MLQNFRHTPRHFFYLAFICLIGSVLLVWAIIQFIGFQDKFAFLLFVLLGALAQLTATTATIKSKTGVTYAISPAVSLAAVPFFGPAAAVLIETATALCLWLIKPADEIKWKRSLPQLFFNMAMSSIAIFAGGSIYQFVADKPGADTWLGVVFSWLLAATVNDQFNLWILTIMLRLQHGKEFHLFTIWRENAWAIPIGVLTTGVGGGFLAYSFNQLGWIGIAIFFLPLFLSAYAFRLYVRQMQAHMDNLENIVAERANALQQLMREKDSFLAVLTHDMKTPLTSINLYATIIRDHPEVVLKKPHLAKNILQNQEVLTNIVNNILDLEKLQADGQMPLDKEEFDLSAFLEEVVEMMQPQAERKHINLILNPAAVPAFVLADRQQIARVLNNLLSNAIKYTQNSGEVRVTLETQGQEVSIQVQDSGYGIPADELPFVFDRFHRVSSHRKLAAGTGLGLAITKAFVEAHGGHIEVTSIMEEGSTFIMHLPILQQDQPEKEEGEGVKNYDRPGTRKQKSKGVTPFISY